MVKRIEFDEKTHTYAVEGVQYPSVTQILAPLTQSHYGSINPSVLQYAADRGKAVHTACELIDYGCDPDIDQEIEPYVKAYMDFLEDYKPQMEFIESLVFNDDLGYCGTVDRVVKVGNEIWVLDIKTYAQPNRANYISVCCQTAAYGMALNYPRYRRKALFLTPKGNYKLIDCNIWENENLLMGDGFQIFIDCLDFYNEIKEMKK